MPLLATLVAAAVAAGTPALPAVADTSMRCDGRVVSEIEVHAELPPLGGLFRRSRRIAGLVRDLHVVTRDRVVRRFLALQEGQMCSELRRSESERILRAQPFLADAIVTTSDDGAGGIRVDVTTYDELSLGLGLAARPQSPQVSAVRLGNANLLGQAIEVSSEWRDGKFYRDSYAAHITDYQLLGRPYQLTAEGRRGSIGSNWLGELTHPFFTDLQRIAWHGSVGDVREYAGFLRSDGPSGALDVRRTFWDVGGIVRIGAPGRLSLFGASISEERESTASDPVLITDSGIVPATDSVAAATLTGRYGRHTSARANAIWGVRNVRFMRVESFDALRGPQDVRIGFQFGALLGRSLPMLGSDDDDIFVASDFYLANGSPHNFVAVQGRGEGREDGNTMRWDGVLTSGRGAWYARVATWSTIVTSAEWAAGWRQRVPFQLSLADFEGGVRGYKSSRVAGAQRAVARVEDRFSLGTFKQLADVGIAAFADAGRLWAGDAPFGVDAKPKIGVGLGFLAAVPPRSKRLWRIDVAYPISADPDAKLEIRISSRDRTRSFYRVPDDVRRGRERSTPASIFNWP